MIGAGGRDPASATDAGETPRAGGTPKDAYHGDVRQLRRARVVAPLAVGLAVAALTASGVAERIDLPVRDGLLRLAPPLVAESVAAVVVDEEAIAAVGRWPWPRERLAALVDAVRRAGARGVVIDVLLPEAAAGDGELIRALAALPAVLACGVDAESGRLLVPPASLAAVTTPAHATFEPDHDGVVRDIMATKQVGGRSLPALSLAAARLADPSIPVPVGVALRPDFRVSANRVPAVSAGRLLAGGGSTRGLAGRVVLLGVTAAGLGDRVMTPTTRRGAPDAGVLVQAAAAEAILRGRLVRAAPPLLSGVIAALLLAAVAAARGPSGRARLAVGLGVVLAPGALAAVALLLARYELPAATLTLATLAAVATVELRAGLDTDARASRVAAVLAGETGGAGAGRGVTAGAALGRVEELASALVQRGAREREARRVMAHELKTPLTSMRGLTQLLAEFELSDEERRRVAGLAAGEAARLQGMVEGLLEVERVSLRDFGSDAVPVDLDALAAERVELLVAGARRAIGHGPAAAVWVRGVRSLLARAIDNLLGNAVNYSPAGSAIAIAVRPDGADAVLEVVDHGPGVPAGERRRIFDRFARGSTAAGTAGFGLGLALVGEVVTWHRGTVAVDETPGGGATFRIRLPLAPSSQHEG